MSRSKKKPVLVEIDNVRVLKWDNENYLIERKETYFSAKDKGEITEYRFKGYYGTLFKALRAIHTKGLLIDENSKQSINSLLKQIKFSEQNIINEIRRIDSNVEN